MQTDTQERTGTVGRKRRPLATQLRRLPVTDDVAVTVLDVNGGFQPLVVGFADLPTELAAGPIPYEYRLDVTPFWLTADDGTIMAIEEQYIP